MRAEPVHWDEVETVVIDGVHLRGRRQRLGAAAGAQGVGLGRFLMGPGERTMPLHEHADEEEFVVVLGGDGVTTDGEHAWAIAAGDAVLHAAGGDPHTFVAGEHGMEVLVYGSGSTTSLTWLPRPNVMWAAPRWLPLDGPPPFAAEEACGPLALPPPAAERPSHVVRIDDVPVDPEEHAGYEGAERNLGRALGSSLSGLRACRVEPGRMSCPPHWHGAEEELFVVLEGGGELLLLDGDLRETRFPLRPGHVVARPPATGVAHALVAGADGIHYLAYGTRHPGEIVGYPRSRKAYLGPLLVRVEPVDDYWDGEL